MVKKNEKEKECDPEKSHICDDGWRRRIQISSIVWTMK